MIEITQADRDAAASGYFAWCGGNPVIPDRMKAGNADDHSMVQAFARHRMEERAAIVAWLRPILEQWLETAREHLDTEVAGRTFEALERMK